MRAPTLLFTLALTGCAAHTGAMRAGDRAARVGAWDAAVSSYEQAADLAPDNARVVAKLDGAVRTQQRERAAAMQRATTRLFSAIATGDWSSVRASIAEARLVDPVAAEVLSSEAIAQLEPKITTARQRGELRSALVMAMVGTWLSGDVRTSRTYTSVRTAYISELEQLGAAGHWTAAIDAAVWLGDIDPTYPAVARISELKADWASQIGHQAKVAEASGNLGSAAVGFNDAFGIDGDRGWLLERDRLAQQVEDDMRFTVRWSNERGPLTAATQQEVRSALEAQRGLRLVASGPANTVVDLDVVDNGCEDVGSERLHTVQVLVGTQQVQNPQYPSTMRELRSSERLRDEVAFGVEQTAATLAEADQDVRRLLDGVLPGAQVRAEREEEEVTWMRRRHLQAEDALRVARVSNEAAAAAHARRLTDLQTTLSVAERDLARARRAVEEANAAQVDPEVEDPEVVRLKSERRQARRAVASAEQEIAELGELVLPVQAVALAALASDEHLAKQRWDEAERQALAPRQALDRVQAELGAAQARVATLREQRATQRQALAAAQGVVTQQLATVDRTPLVVSEDVFEPLTYSIETWERTCTLTASLRRTHGSAQLKQDIVVSRTTTDEWHDAYPQAGIALDPLVFPHTDDSLQAAARTQIGDDLSGLLRGAAHDYYRELWQQALVVAPKEPATALRHWLAVLRLDPTVSDELGLDALRSRVSSADVGWMRGG